jgi:hypothetical protein
MWTENAFFLGIECKMFDPYSVTLLTNLQLIFGIIVAATELYLYICYLTTPAIAKLYSI